MLHLVEAIQETIPSSFGVYNMAVTEAYNEPEANPVLSGSPSTVGTILVNKDECVFGTLFGNALSGHFKNLKYDCYKTPNGD